MVNYWYNMFDIRVINVSIKEFAPFFVFALILYINNEDDDN